MKKSGQLLLAAVMTLGVGSSVLAADDADTGRINRGAGEQQRPPHGAPPGAMQQSGPGATVGDQPQRPAPPTASAPAESNTGAVPGAPMGATGQTMPAKLSPQNDEADKRPIMAQPIALSDEDKRRIFEAVSGSHDTEVRAVAAAPATALPADVPLQDLPERITQEIPAVRGLKYVRLPEKLLLVSPPNRIVVAEITR